MKTFLLISLFFLQSHISFSQVAVLSGGAGAPAGSGENGANNMGLPATGLGCGGGAGSWWGGTGGAGKYGGGGGGAGGYFGLGSINWAGGDGGQGVVIIAFYNGASFVNSVVLIDGSSVTVNSGITSAKVWAIGGGGGGGGATENDGTSGGSGAAGGVAYITKAVSAGNIISYSIGSGGLPGNGSINGAAGGTTSVTIAGTTIYGYGGGPGLYNDVSSPSGGSFLGGDGGVAGGNGYGRSGDVGGGGGGGIGGANGTQASIDGGTGANAIDVAGLFAACATAPNPTAPTLSSFTPTTGLSGTNVTITGSNFTGAMAVYFGGYAASSFTVDSDLQISATVSPSAVTGSVSITLPTVAVSKPIYFVSAPVAPTIGSFSPTNAADGVEVTINGDKLLGTTNVSFGGTNAASFNVVSDFKIVAIVGSGSDGNVSVSSSSGTGILAGFTWLATTAAANIVFSTIQETQITISWSNGNAAKRAVFVKEGTGAITNPTDNITYTASSDWTAKGTALGSSGYYCVYNNSGNSITLTGLTANTLYIVQVFEYNGNAGAEKYYLSTAINNPNSQTTATLLPLSWIDFIAKTQNDNVLLNWSTATEQDSKDFTVQKSNNSINWNNIGTVPASQNSQTVKNYTFIDTHPLQGMNYYRLLQQDLNGRNGYSKIINVKFAGQSSKVFIYPNPVVNGTLNIQLENAGTAQLFNTNGLLIWNKALPAGTQKINTSALNKGLYILRVVGKSIPINIE
ncbi:MAG: T9SS type A sorting domain-containing protein [Chitinophagaceae bacterium]